MKSKAILWMILLLTLGSLAASAQAASCPVRAEGAIFGGRVDDSIPLEARFDAEWLIRGDNTRYNPDIAAFAALVSGDVYFRAKDLDKGTPNRVRPENDGDYDNTAFLRAMGFADVEYVETFRAKEYPGDTNDSATLIMGYLPTEEGEVYVVGLRGCFSAQEWMSAFDIGCPGTDYQAFTGEHGEWAHPENLKGIDVGAQRAMEFIRAFIDQRDDPEKANCVLITGHSRGGMMAELVGAEMEKRPDMKSFTYTFGAMPVTSDPEAAEYQTIFNIFDENDVCADLFPFGQEKLSRYGRSLSGDIFGSTEIREAVAALKGRSDDVCVDPKAVAEYKTLFGQRFPDRASIYKTRTLVRAFASEEEAVDALETCRGLMGGEGLGLDIFCRAGDVEKTGDGCAFTLEYCDGATLWGLSEVMAYGKQAGEAFLTLFDGDDAACQMARFFMDNASGVSGGHQIANSYALTGFVG